MKRNDTLKIIAMVTMLIDHIGVLLLPQFRILRTIGRIAFPIFAYMIAKGYKHTSNRQKYQLRLLIFGLISQVPYMWLNYEMTANFFHFNVILFFLYSTFVLQLLDKTKEGKYNLLYIIPLLFMVALPQYLEHSIESFAFSYSTYGILMIMIFYIFDNQWIKVFALYIILSLVSSYETGAWYLHTYSTMWIGESLTYWQALSRFEWVWNNITTYKDGLRTFEGYFFQMRSMMALPFIFLVDFIKGPTLNKWIGYAFYPVHITVLIIIRLIIGGPIG